MSLSLANSCFTGEKNDETRPNHLISTCANSPQLPRDALPICWVNHCQS